eukprot:g15998.t1
MQPPGRLHASSEKEERVSEKEKSCGENVNHTKSRPDSHYKVRSRNELSSLLNSFRLGRGPVFGHYPAPETVHSVQASPKIYAL